MKIMHIITSLKVGGTERILYDLVKHQLKSHDVFVAYLKEFGYTGEMIAALGVEVKNCAGPAVFFKLVRSIKKFKPDLVHTHLYRANIIGRFAKLFGNNDAALVSSQQSIELYKSRLLTMLDAFSLRFTDMVIANSRTVSSLLQSKESVDPEKIRVVYNGVDYNSYQNEDNLRSEFGLDSGNTVVGYIGRLHKEKGAHFLPEIFKGVYDINPGIRFFVAGGGPLEKYFKNKVKRYELEKAVVFAGWRHDLPRVFNTVDFCVMPSLQESFPQVCLESMSAGRPLIAADVGGIREIVEDGATGFLTETGDVDMMIKKIIALASDERVRLEMGRAGRKKAAEFTNEKMLDSIDKIYDELF